MRYKAVKLGKQHITAKNITSWESLGGVTCIYFAIIMTLNKDDFITKNITCDTAPSITYYFPKSTDMQAVNFKWIYCKKLHGKEINKFQHVFSVMMMQFFFCYPNNIAERRAVDDVHGC